MDEFGYFRDEMHLAFCLQLKLQFFLLVMDLFFINLTLRIKNLHLLVESTDIEKEHFNFYIYNFNGILVHQGRAIEKNEINLNLIKGIYIVKIKTQGTWYTEKLIIQ